jgi:NTE family protein
MKPFLRTLIPILFVALAASSSAQAQKPPQPAQSSASSAAQPPAASTTYPAHHRLTIGVAFAGGSALGFAHIGVLQWFDAHHIPIDYVAGTSMGGLIAGMYASGETAGEIHDFVAGIDWTKIFGPSTPYHDLNFRRKQDVRDFANYIELGWKAGLRLPSGLNSGQGVSFLISSFAAPYGDMPTFDDLPTPFRCVATDLVSGRSVVLDKGSLDTALRSTMSLPGIFDPVTKGNMELVDGGLLDNLPVDVVRSMKPDVVIAVSLDNGAPYDPKNASLVEVAGRSISVMISENERRSLHLADLIISPDLTKLAPTDFTRAAQFEKLGYQAAEAKKLFLMTLAVNDQEWQQYLAQRRARRRHWQAPRTLAVNGAGKADPTLAAQFQPLLLQPSSQLDVQHVLEDLQGGGIYESALYQETEKDGQPELELKLDKKNYGPPLLNFGVTIDGSHARDARFNFAGRITFFNIGFPMAEWRTDYSVGITNLLASEYYWRLHSSKWFLAPRLFVSRDDQDLYQNNVVLSEYLVRQAGAGADLGYALSRNTEFRLGLQWSHIHTSSSIGDTNVVIPTYPQISGNQSLFRAQWSYDGTDDGVLPRRGLRGQADVQWIFHAPDVSGLSLGQYPVLQAKFLLAEPFARKYDFIATAAGGSTLGEVTPYGTFLLGGPLQLSALGPDQLRGDNFYNTDFYALRQLTQDPIGLFSRSYVLLGYELGDAFDDYRTATPYSDGMIGYVAVTRIGALMMGASYGQNNQGRVFFRLGRIF